MISQPYPTKGTAAGEGKLYAIKNRLKKFFLMLDLEKRQFHFTDQEPERKSQLILFVTYKQVKGKWQTEAVKR